MARYLRKLTELENKGVERISSFKFAEMLGLTASQVRQDLSLFGDFGKRGTGYFVIELKAQISAILGMDRGFKGILVGAGNIGRSFLENFCFSECGVQLKAAFDISPELIGTEVCGIAIHSAAELPEYLKKEHVDMAVLTVSKEAAVRTADLLIENGIEAIWNFTNVDIVPPGSPVIVENIHFSDSLLSLSYLIANSPARTVDKRSYKICND